MKEREREKKKKKTYGFNWKILPMSSIQRNICMLKKQKNVIHNHEKNKSSFLDPGITEMIEQVVKVLVTQSCLTLCDPKDCSPPGPFVHGIFQVRILE